MFMGLLKRGKIKKWSLFIIGSFLITIGISIISLKALLDYQYEKQETKLVDSYIENTSSTNNVIITVNSEGNTSQNNISKVENYLGVLEIPIINLKNGFYAKESPLNTISKNIEILKESDMPNQENGNVILAAHSGTGRYAFFRNLFKLNMGDYAYIYYQGLKYEYEIVKIEYQEKDGTITISELEQDSYLTLTTCDQKDKTKQIVITAKLIKTENY